MNLENLNIALKNYCEKSGVFFVAGDFFGGHCRKTKFGMAHLHMYTQTTSEKINLVTIGQTGRRQSIFNWGLNFPR